MVLEAAPANCATRIVTSTAMPTDEPMRCRLFVMLDARDVYCRGTRANAADMVGIIEKPMANPRSRSAPTTSEIGESTWICASRTLPTASKIMPPTTTGRGPMRSVSMPPSGIANAAVTACGSSRRPVCSALYPCTSWRYSGISSMDPNITVTMSKLSTIAHEKVRSLNSSRCSSGSSVPRSPRGMPIAASTAAPNIVTELIEAHPSATPKAMPAMSVPAASGSMSCVASRRRRSWLSTNAVKNTAATPSSDSTSDDDQPSVVLRSTAYMSAITAGVAASIPNPSRRSPRVTRLSIR